MIELTEEPTKTIDEVRMSVKQQRRERTRKQARRAENGRLCGGCALDERNWQISQQVVFELERMYRRNWIIRYQ